MLDIEKIRESEDFQSAVDCLKENLGQGDMSIYQIAGFFYTCGLKEGYFLDEDGYLDLCEDEKNE